MRLAFALVLLVVVSGRGALAGPASERNRAIAAFRTGQDHYRLAEFQLAIEAFKDSYRYDPDPELLFNIAQSYRRLGKDGCASALDFYRNYEAELNARNTATPAGLDATIREMQQCVDDQHAADQPPMPAQPVVVSAPPRPPRRSSRWLELGLGGAAVASAGLGGWLLWDAHTAADQLFAQCGTACSSSSVDGVRWKERAGIGLVTASAVIMTGAIVVWWRHRERAPSPALGVAVGPGGFALTGGF